MYSFPNFLGGNKIVIDFTEVVPKPIYLLELKKNISND